jgi:hypothetical protein
VFVVEDLRAREVRHVGIEAPVAGGTKCVVEARRPAGLASASALGTQHRHKLPDRQGVAQAGREMKGAAEAGRRGGEPDDRAGSIIGRREIEMDIVAAGQCAHVTAIDPAQHLIDAVKARHPARSGMADENARTIDRDRQIGGADLALGFEL